MRRSRILIAADHIQLAELCQTFQYDEFEVVGIVSDGCDLIYAALELNADVVVVDISTPALNGFNAAREVKKRLPTVKVIFLHMRDDAEIVAEAFRRGASGYLLKTCAASEVVTAIRSVLQGDTYLSPTLSKAGCGG